MKLRFKLTPRFNHAEVKKKVVLSLLKSHTFWAKGSLPNLCMSVMNLFLLYFCAPRKMARIVWFSIANHWINMILITILKWILSTQLSKLWHQDATWVQLILNPLIILLPLRSQINKNIWSSHGVENSTSLLVFQMVWHSAQENSRSPSSLYTRHWENLGFFLWHI